MGNLTPSDLKSILHSKRANLYYLEHCRVLVNGGRVEYVTAEGDKSLYWNIPIANTTHILLGTGTSITQGAVRELAKAGVLVGFCGGDGMPLYSATEREVEAAWLTPQSEYRPTEYLQCWVSFWFDDGKRLEAAKKFQTARLELIQRTWVSERIQRDDGFIVNDRQLSGLLRESLSEISAAKTNADLLSREAKLTKRLYALASSATFYPDFVRAKNGSGTDIANRFLDHGNYLAYGLAATAAWVLGLPHGLSVLHGKTRRGGLVFDIADLAKDAIVLPQAFISAKAGDDDRDFRRRCIDNFAREEALDRMIDIVKQTAREMCSQLE